METNPETEFEFFLAQKLGMTVAQMRRAMTDAEFARWSIYYQRLAQKQELERLKAGG